ncbi:YceI family protein [Ruegeria sp. Ofav3-42]|uniref:YceI family protein n=1 Tax=Ruegeria sp. Ofav3-42 TaxID=2917759 RepID=UPI001EF597FE|nr:YceI family protein [Ruegeria sp. Ofav3-42]MCG7519553.1 YceI family protein [Ruegeria sp. Ofav3-42]
MSALTRRSMLAGLVALPLARQAQAALVPYMLSPVGTSVGFSFMLSGVAQSGTMPIQSANVQIDTDQLQNSRVTVVLNVAAARTRLPFARGPMLSQSVLNAQDFPTITFKSTRIQLGPTGRISEGATITGDLTVRGVTRPVTLRANLYRRPGTAADDLSALSILLSGALNRHAYGASGYPDLVADTVTLNIRAELIRKT